MGCKKGRSKRRIRELQNSQIVRSEERERPPITRTRTAFKQPVNSIYQLKRRQGQRKLRQTSEIPFPSGYFTEIDGAIHHTYAAIYYIPTVHWNWMNNWGKAACYEGQTVWEEKSKLDRPMVHCKDIYFFLMRCFLTAF